MIDKLNKSYFRLSEHMFLVCSEYNNCSWAFLIVLFLGFGGSKKGQVGRNE